MNAKEHLLCIRDAIEKYCDEKVKHSFYLEFNRRLLVLQMVQEYCNEGSVVVDLGASPFIISCALKHMCYRVIAVDYDPVEYAALALQYGIKVVKADLERCQLSLLDEYADCIILTEVLEYLNPYYISHALSEINRILKLGGIFILTTPNIASLFRRLKLLLGLQPQYAIHVHEYTKKEVENLLIKHGFRVLKINYSEVCDLTYIDTKQEEYPNIKSYYDLIRLTLIKPAKINVLRTLAYPAIKFIPALRMLIVAVAKKSGHIKPLEVKRW